MIIILAKISEKMMIRMLKNQVIPVEEE